MFGNTLTLPHADGNVVMVKVKEGDYSSEYLLKGALSEWTAKIRHTKTSPTATKPVYERHNVEVQQRVYAADTVPEFTRKAYVVIELLPSDADIKTADALADWLIVAGNLASLNGWES